MKNKKPNKPTNNFVSVIKQIWKEVLVWFVLITYIVVALSFTSVKKADVKCTKININIEGQDKLKFVDKTLVKSIIYKNGIHIIESKIDSINLLNVEDIVTKYPSIKKSQVYKSLTGEIYVNVKQRNPILRIFNNNNSSYYIDEEGILMPLSDKYTAHVLIANGNINEPYGKYSTCLNINKLNYSKNEESKILNDLFILTKYINTSKFWKSQIEQIYINRNEEIELIPKVGNYTIIFGDINNIDEKFENLDALYTKAFKYIGWNKYKTINLKYKNQIVCTLR